MSDEAGGRPHLKFRRIARARETSVMDDLQALGGALVDIERALAEARVQFGRLAARLASPPDEADASAVPDDGGPAPDEGGPPREPDDVEEHERPR